MENIDIDALQKQLAERINALDKQRKEQAENFNREVADRAALDTMERAQQLALYQEAEARREAKKAAEEAAEGLRLQEARRVDRKSTRLNSSHANISYAVFCL